MVKKLHNIHAYEITVISLYGIWLAFKAKLIRLRGKKIIFILGVPRHINLGDQAIACAEAEFVKKRLSNTIPIKIPMAMVLQETKDILTPLIKQTDVVTGHGGGNIGDVYIQEELCRRRFIELLPGNSIIIFPQTVHFTDSEIGIKELIRTKQIYAKHKDLTIVAREKVSYKQMKKYFPDNKVVLTPDIVLSMRPPVKKHKREGLLICLRNDVESKLDQYDKQAISDLLKKHFKMITYTDTISHAKFFAFRSKRRAVQAKINEFRSAKLVITDRIHGMVFAGITGTPCIALANFNHKVISTYEWVRYLPYIKFCDDMQSLDNLYKQINLNKSYSYDPGHFDAYWRHITKLLQANVK